MEQPVVQGETVIALGDQIRARWNNSTKYLMLLVAAVLTVMMVDEFRESLQRPTVGYELSPLMIACMIVALAVVIAVFVAFLSGLMALFVALSRLRLRKEQLLIHYAFGTDGIAVHDGRGVTMTTPWSVVGKARESATAIRLSLKPMGSRYVIKRAFTPDDLRALRAMLREKLGPKARLRPA